MSLVPVFEIGVWNAWILMLPLMLPPPILASVKKGLFKKTESTANLSKTEKIMLRLSKVTLALIFLYSIFLPLKLGTLWFYVGLPICLLGLIGYIVAGINIAIDKAFTAVFGKFHTLEWSYHFQKGGFAPLRIHEQWIAFPGGFPIINDGVIMGGIGVSGGTVEDLYVAKAALEAGGFNTDEVDTAIAQTKVME